MNRADLQDFRAKLIAMQSEIRAISASAAPELKPVVLHQTNVGRVSRIDAMPLQQMSQEVARRRQQLLLKIQGALCRIESGRFPIGIHPFLNVLNGIRLHGWFEHMPKASLQLEIGFDRLALGDIGVGDHSVDRLLQRPEPGINRRLGHSPEFPRDRRASRSGRRLTRETSSAP